MKKMFGLALATITLAGCGGASPQAQLKADCAIVVADPEGKEQLLNMNADEASFCACLNTNVLALDEARQAKARATLSYVAEQSKETGLGIEDVAANLMRSAMLSPDDEKIQAIIEGVPVVGEVFDKIEEDFEAGVCSR